MADILPAPVPPDTAAPSHDPACEQHPRIDVWERRLRSEAALRATTTRGLARGAAYLPRQRAILTEAGLPASLALLPLVESGFRTTARDARSNARGLWQLGEDTARRFGLVVSGARDERLLPEPAARAAARYLRTLYAHYGDWPLALAAYNAGERRIDHALAARPHATFWELAEHGHVPRTSRDFVPHFLAVARIIDADARCGRPAQPPNGGGSSRASPSAAGTITG